MSKQKQDCPVCEGYGTLAASSKGKPPKKPPKEKCPYCDGTGKA